MQMPGMSWSEESGYRYGFQGMERDNEIYGESNSYDFGARMMDPRLGRWWSVDNINKPNLSSYQYGKGNPIGNIDKDGNDEFYFLNNYITYDNNGNYYQTYNGEVPYRIPKAELQISKDGENEYYLDASIISDNYRIIKINSPMTIRGGDANIGKEFNKRLTSLYSFSSQFKDGIIDEYIESWSRFNDNFKFIDFGLASFPNEHFDFKSKKEFFPQSNKNTSLYEIAGTYYNYNEAGNFMYGYALAKNSLGLRDALKGGDILSSATSRRNQDEPWEAISVIKGYYYFQILNHEGVKKQDYQNTFNNASSLYNHLKLKTNPDTYDYSNGSEDSPTVNSEASND
jgi:RHS repeat-associated protein